MKELLSIIAILTAFSLSAQTSGRVYPERNDDLSWENDLVAFRVYGPQTQKNGERSFGYDLFLKYPDKGPVLELLYGNQCSPANWAKVDSLRRIDRRLAKDFENSFTYHLDHGYGMDCYAVGPTLGCGVAAIALGDSIVYPWCYESVEIMENGPDRFKVRLVFAPKKIGDDESVVESRVITLDKGSHLNHCEVSYSGLTKPQKIVVGFPIRMDGTQYCNVMDGIIAIADPTQGAGNGKIFLGVICDNPCEKALILDNHWLLASTISPGETFSYDWGFAWDRTDIPEYSRWIEYLNSYK
ncbi:MAG: DUF4861 domain-containing protein [Muribaculaceae bacterium]|nr:DUF4861 domain-containing protein [Muribaculaceae bacterium]